MRFMGIILAGGKSTRMKCDKANLSWHGQSLLNRQIEIVSLLVGPENTYVSGKRELANSISDIDENLGPLEGLRTVLSSIYSANKYDAAIVLPVDMPLLSVEQLRKLMILSPECEVTCFAGYQLPAVFCNLQNVIAQLTKLKAQTAVDSRIKYSFKNLYKQLIVKTVDTLATSDFINTNTPEEWQNALSKANKTR